MFKGNDCGPDAALHGRRYDVADLVVECVGDADAESLMLAVACEVGITLRAVARGLGVTNYVDGGWHGVTWFLLVPLLKTGSVLIGRRWCFRHRDRETMPSRESRYYR